MTTYEQQRDNLLSLVSGYGSCAVAFSGGVDSAVVAKAARLVLGDQAVAVTGVSEVIPVASSWRPATWHVLSEFDTSSWRTDELSQAGYVANAPDRCYHCKTELYSRIAARLAELEVDVIVNGANADDLSDYRPGMQAASEWRIHSPLAECGITKATVREIAAGWQLPVADKPASPCLSSRIAYGEQVTPERLRMIDRAEGVVRSLGLREVRVRYHAGDMARIEVPAAAITKLMEDSTRSQLATQLKAIGFKFVTLDLEGFRSGSLNVLVPREAVMRLP